MTESDDVYKSRKEAREGIGSFVVEIIKVFFWALIIILPIRIFLFQPFFVQGASMEPSFEDGQYLIISELGYKKTDVGFGDFQLFSIEPFKELNRGDIAVFRYPKKPEQFFIKRIITLPGETIILKDSQITIINEDNPEGFVLDESEYLSPDIKTSGDFSRKLADDEYFMLGDNRSSSHDSRSWGPLKKDKLIGRVVIRAWPLSMAGVF